MITPGDTITLPHSRDLVRRCVGGRGEGVEVGEVAQHQVAAVQSGGEAQRSGLMFSAIGNVSLDVNKFVGFDLGATVPLFMAQGGRTYAPLEVEASGHLFSWSIGGKGELDYHGNFTSTGPDLSWGASGGGYAGLGGTYRWGDASEQALASQGSEQGNVSQGSASSLPSGSSSQDSGGSRR